MTLQELTTQLRKLERRFKAREMHEDALLDWYEALKHIPSEAWGEICRAWWTGERRMPTPGDLEGEWRTWLGRRPGRQAPRELWCDGCLGYGGYLVEGLGGTTTMGRKIPPDRPIWVTCTCRQAPVFTRPTGKIQGIQRSRSELEQLGVNILWPELGEDAEKIRVTLPTTKRQPGFDRLEASLPLGDKDEIPF